MGRSQRRPFVLSGQTATVPSHGELWEKAEINLSEGCQASLTAAPSGEISKRDGHTCLKQSGKLYLLRSTRFVSPPVVDDVRGREAINAPRSVTLRGQLLDDPLVVVLAVEGHVRLEIHAAQRPPKAPWSIATGPLVSSRGCSGRAARNCATGRAQLGRGASDAPSWQLVRLSTDAKGCCAPGVRRGPQKVSVATAHVTKDIERFASHGRH